MSRNKIAKRIGAMSTVALIGEVQTLLEAYASPSLSFAGVLLDEVRDRFVDLESRFEAAMAELPQLRKDLEDQEMRIKELEDQGKKLEDLGRKLEVKLKEGEEWKDQGDEEASV